MRSLQVDPDRISAQLAAFARIGYASDGSINRLAFSQADLQARELLRYYLARLGLKVRIDGFGNVFGRYRGSEPQLPPLLVGSHLDTVPGGGRFDGTLGVAAALELVAVLIDAGQRLRHSVEVVSFSCEESSRYGRGTLGSGIVAGAWGPDELLELRDRFGVSLGHMLELRGLDPTRARDARRQPGDYLAFLEIHIEQGRVLEEASLQAGIVEAIAAPTRFRLQIEGRADHSGATPMHLRRDALAGAAEVILSIEDIAAGREEIVGTVGRIEAQPGVMNVVPGRVTLDVDIRGSQAEAKRRCVEEVLAALEEIAGRRRLELSVEILADQDPVVLDAGLVHAFEQVAERRGMLTRRMISGAGHDAMHMAALCPTGMLLVPSRAGVSHSREEWTDLDDLVTGVQLLVDAALEVAG